MMLNQNWKIDVKQSSYFEDILCLWTEQSDLPSDFFD